jgi:hypothetical protein
MFGGHIHVQRVADRIDLLVAERDALLAECETLRRKARAFDAIADSTISVGPWFGHKIGPCWRVVRWGSSRPDNFDRDLLTAIEAALAAKESKQ